MKISRLLLIPLALLTLDPRPAAADDKTLPPLPPPLQNMVSEGAQIRYLGRENNMDGWVTLKAGQPQYFYVSPDQQTILMGIMFNNKGDVITLRQVNALRQKEGPALDALAGLGDLKPNPEVSTPAVTPDFSNPKALAQSAGIGTSKADQLYAAVAGANAVALGKKDAPVIYTFIDPECPHCHDLLQAVRKSGYLEKGLVQLKLIPVGVVGDADQREKAQQEAAFLLASSDPAKALYDHLDGTTRLTADPNVNTQGVQRNMSLMQDWKFEAVPISVYKDASGKVKILPGAPKDLKKIVAELR